MLFVRSCVFIFMFLACMASTALSQQSDKSIDRLKSDNNRLRAVANDPSTPPEVKEVNSQLLEKNRALLKDALNRGIEALQKYEANMGDVLDPTDRRAVDEKIDGYRYDLAQLEPRIDPARMSGLDSAITVPQSAPVMSAQPAKFVGSSASRSVAISIPTPTPEQTPDKPIRIVSPDAPKHTTANSYPFVFKVADGISKINVVVSVAGRAKDPISLSVPASGVIDTSIALDPGDNDIKATNPLDTGQFSEVVITREGGTKSEKNEGSNANNPMRLLFGFEQAGASSTASKGQPFIDLMTSTAVEHFHFCTSVRDSHGIKIAKGDNCAGGQRQSYPFSFWTNIRLTSIASQALPDFGNLTDTAVTSFFGSNQSSKVNDIVQAFQVRFGLEQDLGHGFSLIGGVGATSPLAVEKTLTAFKIPHISPGGDAPKEFKDIFGPDTDFTNLNTLILTVGDRDRFQRNWFAGGRLRARLVDDSDAYPSMFELTFGQDEVLTNRLIGGVVKFDSFVPIPVKGLKFLYFGASFTSKLTGKVRTATLPFFLEPATNFNLFGNDVVVRNLRDVHQLISDRDFFSFRFGVDLIGLIKNSKQKETP